MNYLKITFEKEYDSLDKCHRTLSVKELIYELKQYDDNNLVCISLDNGEYYSRILPSRFKIVEVNDGYDEEDWMYKFNSEQQELLKANGFSYTKKLGLTSIKETLPNLANIFYDETQDHFFVLVYNHRIRNDADLKKAQEDFAWKSQLAIDLNELKRRYYNV